MRNLVKKPLNIVKKVSKSARRTTGKAIDLGTRSLRKGTRLGFKAVRKGLSATKKGTEIGFNVLEKTGQKIRGRSRSMGGSKRKGKSQKAKKAQKKEKKSKSLSERFGNFTRKVGSTLATTADIGIKTTKRATTAAVDVASGMTTGAFKGAKVLVDSTLDTAPAVMSFAKGSIANTKNTLTNKSESSFKKKKSVKKGGRKSCTYKKSNSRGRSNKKIRVRSNSRVKPPRRKEN